MKGLSILGLALSMSSFCFAQDRVITKDGDVFDAYRIDIGSTFVYYTKEDKDNAALQKIAKADVLMIKKKDGTKIDVTEYVPQTSTSQTIKNETEEQQGTTQVTLEDLSPEAKAANKTLIAKINAPVNFVIPEKHQKDIGKKGVTSCFACFGVTSNSILCNDDVEVGMKIGRLYKKDKKTPAQWNDNVYNYLAAYTGTINPAILFSIKNKTLQTLYIDLANTFYVRMGQSTCYYVPTSTTTSNSSSGGIGVNLGAVTGALGIGGVAGTLANGINVGGGSSNMISNTTYSQRVIAIAPLSTVSLSPQYFFGNEKMTVADGLVYDLINHAYSYEYGTYANFSSKTQAGVMMYGDHYVYSHDCSPIQMSFFVAYSKSESCTSEKVLSSHYYLNNVFGTIFPGKTWQWGELDNKNIPHFVIDVTNNNGSSFPKQ